MFYFFQRGSKFVRCEIAGDEASGYRITVVEPEGRELTETLETSEAAHARWLQIQERYTSEGWWGPHGREH